MKRLVLAGTTLLAATFLTGCAYLGGNTDLRKVEADSGLKNVTTGDGTFENYTATGHHTGTELGIGVGIPFVFTLFEIFPGRSNEQLLTDIAKKAQEGGADAMINAQPGKNTFTGIPLFFVGLYVDRAEGTGIKTH